MLEALYAGEKPRIRDQNAGCAGTSAGTAPGILRLELCEELSVVLETICDTFPSHIHTSLLNDC